jgi:LmbE family N-acetylglucosaminyl deacetylase
VLCLGAHADDIEIGAGGLLARLLDEVQRVACHWVVLGADDPARAGEARASASSMLRRAVRQKILVESFRSSYFPYIGLQVKEYFETLKDIPADLILTHARHDLHQDHRLVSELTYNTFRDHLVLEYEIPKFDGDCATPTLYVTLTAAAAAQKVDHIMSHFGSQKSKPWFTPDTLWALLRLRGVECRSPSGYAEAFFVRKMVLSAAPPTTFRGEAPPVPVAVE